MKKLKCPTSGLIVTLPNDEGTADVAGSISGIEGVEDRVDLVSALGKLEAATFLRQKCPVSFYRYEVPFGRSHEFIERIYRHFETESWLKGRLYAVEPDHPVKLHAPLGPGFLPGGSHDDYLRAMGVHAAHQAGLQGAGSTITVIDSGYDGPAIGLAGWQVLTRPFAATNNGDADGHGTAMLELARDVAPEATFTFVRVCDASDDVTIWGLISALVIASRDADADIINMSLGFSDMDAECPFCGGTAEMRAFALQCIAALVANTPNSLGREPILLAATGNDGSDKLIASPANYGDVVAVGSVDLSGRRSQFSNYDALSVQRHHIMAFGGQRNAQDMVTEHTGYSTTGEACLGTSCATAYASGMMALLRAQDPNADRHAFLAGVVRQHVRSQPINSEYGAGLLTFNAASAARAPYHTPEAIPFGRTRVPLPRR